MKAFILIKAKIGTEEELVKSFFEIPEVNEVHGITGDHDFLVVMNTKEKDLVRFPAEKIVEVLNEKIRKMEHILETKTVIPTYSEVKEGHNFELESLAKGFIYVKVKPGQEKNVMKELFKTTEIRETHMIPGEYDILTVVEVKKTLLPPHYPETITKIVMDKISKIRDVKGTDTIIPFSSSIKS